MLIYLFNCMQLKLKCVITQVLTWPGYERFCSAKQLIIFTNLFGLWCNSVRLTALHSHKHRIVSESQWERHSIYWSCPYSQREKNPSSKSWTLATAQLTSTLSSNGSEPAVSVHSVCVMHANQCHARVTTVCQPNTQLKNRSQCDSNQPLKDRLNWSNYLYHLTRSDASEFLLMLIIMDKLRT